MWKMFMMYVMPLFYPLTIAYALLMKALGPMGVPDFLGIMQDEEDTEPEE